MKHGNYESRTQSLLANERMLAGFKRLRDSWLRSGSAFLHGAARLVTAAATVARLLRDSRLRSEYITRLRRPDQHLQGSTFTLQNRYPALFEECRILLADIPAPRLLSFGCSTGEEVQSLASAMPNATVVGVDLNDWCIQQARRNSRNENCSFLHRSSPDFQSLADLDAIFCLAVFQRTENRDEASERVATGFTFDQFEQELRMLDAKLKPGGLFFIDHSDFRFEDSEVAKCYEAPVSAASQRLRKRRLFSRDNVAVADEYTANRIFVKRSVPRRQAQ